MHPVIRCCLVLVFGLAASSTQAVKGHNPNTDLAQQAVAEFASALKSELQAAMKAGGPVAAINVCNEKAPAIAAAVSEAQGMEISRVSLKNRNPGNAPNDWQREGLENFEYRLGKGYAPSELTWENTLTTANGREYRFMKAIPTQGICLACHGQSIDPSVAEKLAELYPDDKATGYQAGEIRGAFVVVRKL